MMQELLSGRMTAVRQIATVGCCTLGLLIAQHMMLHLLAGMLP